MGSVQCGGLRIGIGFHETLVRVIQESPYADRVVTLDNPTFEGRKTQAIQAIRQATGFTPRTGIS